MKFLIILSVVIMAAIGIIIGLVAYSYTLLQPSLSDISIANIDWNPSLVDNLLKLAVGTTTGNVLGTALFLITGVKLNLLFTLSNPGIFPVYIPNISYDLFVNDVKMGKGNNNVDMTLNPGESRNFSLSQDLQINGLEPAITSIIHSNGTINLQVNGTAYFKFLGMTIPIPFKSSKQFSILDEIKNYIK